MRVFACYSTQRSGHSSVVWWLMHQWPDAIYDPTIYRMTDIVANRQLKFELAAPRKKLNWQDQNFAEYDNVYLAYERDSIATIRDMITTYEDKEQFLVGDIEEIIILRDFKNTVASHVKRGNLPLFPNVTIPTWKDRAEAIVNGVGYFINYNRYHCEPDYRRQVAADLGMTFTDLAVDMLMPNAGGSSFTKMNPLQFDQLNTRFKTVEDSQAYIGIMEQHHDCLELSNEIFGMVL